MCLIRQWRKLENGSCSIQDHFIKSGDSGKEGFRRYYTGPVIHTGDHTGAENAKRVLGGKERVLEELEKLGVLIRRLLEKPGGNNFAISTKD